MSVLITPSKENQYFIERACQLAVESVKKGTGPFGAVIVDSQTQEILSETHNQVTQFKDPTAHAEICAIRQACQKRDSHSLENTILYSSSFPCPMCLSAVYWARISKIIYANTADIASEYGFDDVQFHQQLFLPDSQKSICIEHIPLPESEQAFQEWEKKEDKIPY
jgi:tRNA(Arg) A34 adenosine deaminase TadA